MFADYGARVRIVHCEASPEQIEARNRARSKPVPAQALTNMLERWQTANVTSAPSSSSPTLARPPDARCPVDGCHVGQGMPQARLPSAHELTLPAPQSMLQPWVPGVPSGQVSVQAEPASQTMPQL